MRAGKLVTETGNLIVPEDFLFLPLVAQDSDQPQPPLKTHLVSFPVNGRSSRPSY